MVAYLTVATQWDVGMAGRTGMRYGDCLALLGTYLPSWKDEHPGVWSALSVHALMQDVQIIETGLLSAWGEPAQPEATPA